jgi:cytochrome c oxidase cbb3-type subunit III
MLPILQRRAGIILVAWAACALANAQLISRPIPPADAVERGQKEFVASCGFCHGSTAKGGEGGPDLVRSVVVLDDETGDRIGPVVLNGRPEKGMPKFNYTKEQISDLAAFLRSRTQAAANRRDYKLLNVNTGNAKEGQAYFTGTGKCNTCHSSTGDLAGVAKRYETNALLERFLYPMTRQRPGMAAPANASKMRPTVTVTQGAGKAISGTLEYIDDFSVALRDSSGEYHSVVRGPAVKVEIQDPLAAHEALLPRYSDEDMHNVLAYLETLQ